MGPDTTPRTDRASDQAAVTGDSAASDVAASADEQWVDLFAGPRGGLAWVVSVLGGLALIIAASTLPERGAWLAPSLTPALAAGLCLMPALSYVDACRTLLPTVLIRTSLAASGLLALAATAVSDVAFESVLNAATSGACAYLAMRLVWFLAPPGFLGEGDIRLVGLGGFLLGLISPLHVLVGLAVVPALTAVLGLIVLLALSAVVRAFTRPSRASSSPGDGADLHETAQSTTQAPWAMPFGPWLCLGIALLCLLPDLPQRLGLAL
ncbi:hypothetical protein [Nocardioides sp. Leaf285]|uniref:hypothetical protein n=1 Tax=Nocardioides sp. Leaf285 TaxID=1736322 RepID=UPI000702F103|nr:hypothetical protein [Nocardioides sp. Leaf285]KQP63146.1 hypothetical protein ASF47_19240 [Nocardioides sp. Leaf285]